jgi:hypothetical protein
MPSRVNGFPVFADKMHHCTYESGDVRWCAYPVGFRILTLVFTVSRLIDIFVRPYSTSAEAIKLSSVFFFT